MAMSVWDDMFNGMLMLFIIGAIGAVISIFQGKDPVTGEPPQREMPTWEKVITYPLLILTLFLLMAGIIWVVEFE